MRKPLNSVVDDPRPVPNSKRPGASWSSIATFSATRAGWQIGGVMLISDWQFSSSQLATKRCARKARKTSSVK